MRRARIAALMAGALLGTAAPAAALAPLPIPGPLSPFIPPFSGGAVAPQPIPGPYPPANPALAPDGRSGSGLAAGNGGASPFPGPLGRQTVAASAFEAGSCSSLAFDARARLLAICSTPVGPNLRLLDPATLSTIATMTLPLRPNANRSDLAGGTHFVVRADGTLLIPTNARTLLHVGVDAGALRKLGTVGLAGVLEKAERPFAVAAGYDGRDWVAGDHGTIVALGRGGGAAKALHLHEPIAEDMATDPSGTYVVTQNALYRLQARDNGAPFVVWRLALASAPKDFKAGRIHPGPGTPPAIVAGGRVAVADARNPPRIVVARINATSAGRVACTVPVFEGGKGSIEAQLVVAGRSIVATNAYGYSNETTTELGGTTTGGIVRVVAGRHGCRVAWTSAQVSPSAQPVVSRATGLLYTLTKPRSFPDAWRLTALDWRTGAVRFSALAGEGLGHNSNGGAVALGPDGAAYAGTFGGVVRFGDLG